MCTLRALAILMVFAVSASSADGRTEAAVIGPQLTVTGAGVTVVTTALDTPPTVVDVPAGTPVPFCWTAEASSYPGVVTGYRYGYDIADLNDPDAWEVPWTAFSTPEECSPARVFFFGTHTFTVEVMDDSGYHSRVPITMNILAPLGTRSTTWGGIKALYREH